MFSIHSLPNSIPHEKVVRIIRKDIFILLKRFSIISFILVLPLAFFYIASANGQNPGENNLAKAAVILGTSAYYLFVLLFAFFSFIDYYLDVWIITDKRIIDIEQRGFFSRVISENKIYRIQDVTSECHGIMATLLKYGDVHLQTAGTKQRFMFKEVPDPEGIRNEIIRLMEASKREHKADSQNADF